MRIPSFPTIVRAFYTVTHTTASYLQPARLRAPTRSPFALRSMPTVPFLGSLFGSKASSRSSMEPPVQKSENEWQAILSPGTPFSPPHPAAALAPLCSLHPTDPSRLAEQFRVLREKGTEAPFTGSFDQHHPAAGVYACAGCQAPLYRADHKFTSGCGWPAYFDSIPGAVARHTDRSFGMARTEIVCARCGGHLGHVFKGEGYKKTPADERHCVNSVSLRFVEEEQGEGVEGVEGKGQV